MSLKQFTNGLLKELSRLKLKSDNGLFRDSVLEQTDDGEITIRNVVIDSNKVPVPVEVVLSVVKRINIYRFYVDGYLFHKKMIDGKVELNDSQYARLVNKICEELEYRAYKSVRQSEQNLLMEKNKDRLDDILNKRPEFSGFEMSEDKKALVSRDLYMSLKPNLNSFYTDIVLYDLNMGNGEFEDFLSELVTLVDKFRGVK